MKRSAAYLLGLCCLCLAAFGVAAPQTPNPSVDSILARYVGAIGGRQAVSKLTSRVSKGTLEITGVEARGTAESYAKAPNKYLSIITFPGFGESRRGFDGRTGWIKDPNAVVIEMAGQQLSSEKRSSEFYQSIKFAELYPKMTLKGQEKVSGSPAYVLESAPGDGTLRRMYFDVSSGLMVRSDEEYDTPDGRANPQSFLEDYRDVEGVKLPFTIRQLQGAMTFTIRLSDVRMNQPIDDAVFVKPAR